MTQSRLVPVVGDGSPILMIAKQACIVASFVAAIAFSGCQQKPAPPKSQAAVFRLFDLFQPDDLKGKVAPEDVGWKPVEWSAAEMAPWTPPPKAETNSHLPAAAVAPALGYRAIHDLGELKVDQGRLVGDITGPAPVLNFSLRYNRGGAESVKFIEVRMNVSGAKQIWLRPERAAAVDEKALVSWATQTNAWSTSTNVADGKLQTYRFEITSNAGAPFGPPGPPPTPPAAAPAPAATPVNSTNAASPAVAVATPPRATPAPAPPGPPGGPGPNAGGSDLRHFALAFRDGQSGKFAIESIRFVSEREEKLKEPSGQQWAGLAEIYRATLAAKSPESFHIPVRALPERARLDFSYGTKEDVPVRFKVSVAPKEGTKEGTSSVLFEKTVTIPGRWQRAQLDLAGYAGKSVVIELALSAEKKGLWGFWGTPEIRSHPGTMGAANSVNGTRRKPRGVILLVTDTLRKDHLNIYGYSRETVIHLKKFAEEGVSFSHAISQATWTKVSVPSIVTSLYPLSHTVLGFDHGLPASAKTMAEVFRDAGYATVAYSSVPFTGKMNNMHQGYDELHEIGSVSDREYESKTTRPFVDRLIPWLEQHQDEPFFVFLHVFDPHSPFRPRPPYDTLWGAPGAKERMDELDAEIRKLKVPNIFGLPEKSGYAKTGHDPDELLKIYVDWYDGSIRGMDAEIGRLLEAMRDLGLDQDTLMVWVADHGEEFWEHGKLFHGQSVYGELNQVPMVYRWPSNPELKKGAMIDHQVQNIDLMPTVLELAGIQGPSSMQGRSLVPLLNGSGIATWQDEPAITETVVDSDQPGGPGGPDAKKAKPHFGIIDHGWKLVRKEVDPEAQQELYEHPADNLNLTNVIKSDPSAGRVRSLNDLLGAWKVKAKAAQLPSDDTMAQQLSSEELRRLRALGYIGGGTSPKPATNTVANTNAPAATVKKDAH
jgi:arylsulfatase A-like enzyme